MTLAWFTTVLSGGRHLSTLIRRLDVLTNLGCIRDTRVACRTMDGNVIARILAVLVDVILFYLQDIRRDRARNIIVELIPTVFTIIRSKGTVEAIDIHWVYPVLDVCFMDNRSIISSLRTTCTRIMDNRLVVRVRKGLDLRRDINELPIRFIDGIGTINRCAFVRVSMLTRGEVVIAFLRTRDLAWYAIFTGDRFRVLNSKSEDDIRDLFRCLPYQPFR